MGLFFFSHLYKEYKAFATVQVQFPGLPICYITQEMFLINTLQCMGECSH